MAMTPTLLSLLAPGAAAAQAAGCAAATSGASRFSRSVPTAFSSQAKKEQIADALIQGFVGDFTSQPSSADMRPVVVNLIDTLTQGCDDRTCPSSRTRTVVKAACSSVLSSAPVTLY